MRVSNKIYKFFYGKEAHSLKINTLANFSGNAWIALVGIVFVPVNLHYLGVEAYGIIGVFNSMQAFIWLFDLGMSGVIARELPHISALPEKTQEIADLTRTAEIINWLMGIVISSLLVSVSPLVALYWLQGNQLSTSTISQALMILGAGFITQWTLNFYSNGLAALQKQTLQNLINIICGTTRSVGGVLVLIFISPTIQAFLILQIIVGTLHLILTASAFKKCLPEKAGTGHFRWSLLKSRFGFASGLTIMSILGLILHQLDKIILSRLLSLEFFGYYTLATTITSLGLGIIPRSIANAVYPRFSYLVSINDEEQLRNLYHRVTQIMAVIMLPLAAILIIFPYEVLILWTQNEKIAVNTWLLLMVLAIGTSLYGFLNIPFYVQLANGWTKIVITSALIAICTITPTMIFSVIRYGAIAGAVCWTLLVIFHLLVDVQVMHRHTLRGEQWKWYFIDILKTFFTAIVVTAFCRSVIDIQLNSRFVQITIIGSILIFTYLCTAFSTETTRREILKLFK